MNERKYFGTDGVRAVAGEFPLTAAWVMNLGAAAGEVLKRQHERPSVVIGKDTRQSGDMLEAALAAGLTSRGVTVIHVGVLPTPGVSYLTRHLGADAGVVISASHNPYQDNGIKFFGRDGQKLSDATELEIEAAIDEVPDFAPVTGVNLGSVTNYTEAERLYINFLLEHAPDLSGLRVAMDCANGAAYRVGPKVFQAAGADVFAVYTTPDGRNINRGCGSTHLDHLQRLVRGGDYDLGVAFDGDADRALFVDSRGNVVHGDHMLLLNARARGDRAVVATIMSNMALEVKLREAGIPLERTAVGDRYVHERLHQQGLTLGGEQSGHVLFLDVSPTGDGVLSALLTLRAMKQLGTTLDELYDELVMFPQTLVNVRVADKKSIARDAAVQLAVSAAESRLSGRGRVNLRPSGTENLIRVMVEGPDEAEIHEVARTLADVVESRGKVGA
ncbi:phosphoglucosamine mutase [Deinococcus metallilatus]|uniref:Phosphoglucosamine mutase n=1 Tax=Deinococcus metallilatus TaxID=1211322 RepID=A0AAE5YRU6_9DEIO|nr:phosphoglucosamine mutase [Deinococcus metallilatus]MBB5295973.1 phosphoglucosamine mutase [Deinococcus metallilatus]QBY08204.1 phosphoglucosamine mutase [Deinococcus metallilatus]RXJ11935.1 phosphoglucosamine mutase [Deinococcus metallilatus]TLK25833.1 phosphoglucosamine mutase [Deinococcus metallilatus]GMA14492.1 phosphoglucosamine mutase [Deinococcus metallilatus]